MKLCVLLSLAILGFFVYAGIKRFGLLGSYSSYAAEWDYVLLGQPIWSIVTFAAAFLMLPPMIEAGDGNPLQFLGFFAPLYLIVVSLTPKYASDGRQYKIHVIGAWLCAIMSILWLCLVCGLWYILVVCICIAFAFAAYCDRFDAYIFWGEMILFCSTYLALGII